MNAGNDANGCTDSNCGCHVDSFPTDERCPACGKHLRLIGNAQTLVLRLSCPACAYQGALLTREKIAELL